MDGKKILMIEDDACFLEVMKYFLEMEKYQFTGSTGTKNIIPLVRSIKPNLIILDYILPYENGGDLCYKLHDCRGLEHIPIVLISAYPENQLPLAGVPFSIFIPKPFDLSYLLACMKRLLRHRVGAAA